MNIGLGIGIPFAKTQIWLSLFDPSKLFANGEQGVWYDPSDMTTLFQDAAGTTPVTAVEQPVGLMLDKSKGLVLGPELATAFSALRATLTNSVGFPTTCTSTGSTPFGIFGSALSAGRWYEVEISVSGNTTGSLIQVDIGSKSVALSVSGSAGTAKAKVYSGTTGVFYVYSNVSGAFTITALSVRELPGNHAYQTVSTKRGILSARRNQLVGTETLATQTVTTRATRYILSFCGTGTVTLSGTSSAGPLVGTGANNRVYLEFTPTAGTLTLTVSGTVLKAQLEVANEGL